jgi:3-hydroxyisobutyrate dehydrogenase-like beta-hydroxyacid dehydrogenase
MGMESGQIKIGIIGAGKLGTAMAGRLIKMGHAVMLSFSKDLERRWRLLRSQVEAQLCQGDEIAIVGGGNSAG